MVYSNMDLFKEYRKTQDWKVRNKLILQHKGLVYEIINKRFSKLQLPASLSIEKDDLIQCGFLALIKAIEGFDPEMGTAFTTYAYPVIYTRILSELRVLSPAKGNRYAVHSKIKHAVKYLAEKGVNDPDFEQLSKVTGITVITIRNTCLEMFLADTVSMQTETIEENTIQDLIESPYKTPEENIIDLNISNLLKTAMAPLSEKERHILIDYYFNKQTLRAISYKYKVTRERIRQIKVKALEKVKNFYVENQIEK